MTRLSCALFAITLAVACSSEFEVDYHGRVRIAEGDYRVLTSFSEGDQEFAMVVDLQDEARPLLLIPFDGEPACAAPEPAAAFFAVQTRDGPRIAVYGSSERPRSMQFIDERCRPHLSPQPDSVDVDFEGEFFLVETESGRLYYYDPWRDREVLISSRVQARGSLVDIDRRGPFEPDATWLLEGDRVVLRDLSGRVLMRAGEAVKEVAVASNGQQMIFSDDDGLFRLDGDGSPPERLADAGCELRYDRILLSSEPAYMATMLSPCEERTLVAVVPPDNVVIEVADDVVSHFRHQRAAADGLPELWLFYTTQPPDGARDERRHFMLEPDGETRHELDVPLDRRSLIFQIEPMRKPHPRWLFITAEDPPRLGTWAADSGFTSIAENVQAVLNSPAGLLVLRDVDEERGGTLQRFDGGGLETLARDVPEDGLIDLRRAPPPSSLSGALQALALDTVDSVLHDFDGDSGTLSLLRPTGELSTLGRQVPLSSTNAYLTTVRGSELARPLEGAQILAYLEGFDPETRTGRLSVFVPSGAVLTIDEGVGSHTDSSDPSRPGLLYAVRTGERRGLWFARQ